MDLLLWGFLTLYLGRYKATLPSFITFFLGALILWDILFRAQQGICISFLEEIWSRNFLNLFVSPLSTGEFLASTMLVSLKVLGASAVTISAYVLYSFNVFVIGVSLVPFVVNLVIMGWAIGVFTTAVILRSGQEAEVPAWGLALLFQPVAAVFYPVSLLPPFLAIAQSIPAAHVFEGMRAVIEAKGFSLSRLLWATSLNAVYLAGAVLFFNLMFRVVKAKGLLVRMGE